ncbi:MAG TPA: hypothetical protein PKX92_08115 [Edaphocola sp.]|nr:hypothetical protein [Edaphocola sp.]
MQKIIIAISALSILLVASCGNSGKNGDFSQLAQKWEQVQDPSMQQQRDSMYNEQKKSLDTLTVFPQELLDMKAEFNKMPQDSIATLPPDLVELLQSPDVKVFKTKMLESLEKVKRSDDSLIANSSVIFDFGKDSIIRNYASHNPEFKDSLNMFKPDFKTKKIYMFTNPKMKMPGMVEDTVVYDILFLNNDSLSIIPAKENKHPEGVALKPLNFRKFVEKKK